MTRIFDPINGIELRELLEKTFHRLLNQKAELFQMHLTYPVVEKLAVTVELELFPHEPPRIELHAETGVESENRPDEKLERQSVKLEESRAIGTEEENAPDRVRIDEGMPTLETIETPSGHRFERK